MGQLRELGFRRVRADEYSAGDMLLTVRHGWLTLIAAADTRAGAGDTAMLGCPGLWKTAIDGSGGRILTFDVPLAALVQGMDEGNDDEIDTADAVAALVRWAIETRPGAVMPSWQPPPADQIASIVPEATRSLRCGPHLQRVAIVAQEGRLALRVPICRAGEQVAGARRQWLDRLLADGRELRMVRVGLQEAGSGSALVEAEIDLSGAPAGVLETTLPIALDALRACFSQLAATAAVIGDPQCRSRVLEEQPHEVLKTLDPKFTNARSKKP
ncbi:MAG: hypothetical protein ACYTA3_07570 [Planctomycetota bacterium]|jgi:hypothetical protein